MTATGKTPLIIARRTFLLTGAAGLVAASLPLGAMADTADADAAIRKIFGDIFPHMFVKAPALLTIHRFIAPAMYQLDRCVDSLNTGSTH